MYDAYNNYPQRPQGLSDLEWYKHLLNNFDPYYEMSEVFETFVYNQGALDLIHKLQPSVDKDWKIHDSILPEPFKKYPEYFSFVVTPKNVGSQEIAITAKSLEKATEELWKMLDPKVWDLKSVTRVINTTFEEVKDDGTVPQV